MRIVTATIALIALSAPAGAATCDPDAWISDPTDFLGLPVQDFQGIADGFQSWGHDEANPYTIDGVNYWPDFWVTTSWCIPGMDSSPPCGGSNHYLANGWQTFMASEGGPTQGVGFDWGTQAQYADVTVYLSDQTTRVFSVGQTGFFGYCTGSPALLIEKVMLQSADGGIDNVRFGTPTGAPPVLDLTHNGFVEGQPTTLMVTGADPAEKIYFGRGTEGVGPCPPPLGGLCIDLVNPKPLGSSIADALGVATLDVTPPVGSAGQTISIQSYARRGTGGVDSVKSGVITATVQ